MKTLVNLIGGQTVPNLIAYKWVKPDKVVLLFSENSVQQKNNFKQIISESVVEEREVKAFDFDSVKATSNQIISNNDDVILNFTGGTKIMSTAAFLVFYQAERDAIYIDSENHRVLSFTENGMREDIHDIRITIEEYLKINGHEFEIGKVAGLDDGRKAYMDFMEDNHNVQLAKFLDAINQEFERDRKNFYRNEYAKEEGKYRYRWDNTEKKSIISINGNEFEITGKNSVKYINGMWFEDLAYERKFKSQTSFDEIKRNVHIKERKRKLDMIELDIVGIKGDTLYLFEFKSGKPRRETLNNLKTIKEQFGTYSKVFLITYFGIDENGDAINQRMEDLNIKFYKFSDLELNSVVSPRNPNL